ncbi:hypothetical protein [Deinococcus humi]|uniref:Uncharacterized protein n=1 Tax=Deinococcus humi TaxID=662880 RepID=A0A7W8JVY1_9DEIO|nr:hypothetical protein [Deinococcus humi]MBB5363970.1 hypothetical protein [Deinococcus humi]
MSHHTTPPAHLRHCVTPLELMGTVLGAQIHHVRHFFSNFGGGAHASEERVVALVGPLCPFEVERHHALRDGVNFHARGDQTGVAAHLPTHVLPLHESSNHAGLRQVSRFLHIFESNVTGRNPSLKCFCQKFSGMLCVMILLLIILDLALLAAFLIMVKRFPAQNWLVDQLEIDQVVARQTAS